MAGPEEFGALAPEERIKVRDALFADTTLVQQFFDENPMGLQPDDLEIVHSWRHLIAGGFYVVRELKKYTVFLAAGKQPMAYGVLALAQPFEELIGRLPVLVKTVLLPFEDKIIYDGLITYYSISFGPGIRRSLTESFNEAKQRQGIVTALPAPTEATIIAAIESMSKSFQRSKPMARKNRDRSPALLAAGTSYPCRNGTRIILTKRSRRTLSSIRRAADPSSSAMSRDGSTVE